MNDLCFGIGPWHIRVLCENVMEGGRGYTPGEVGDMTLDQIFMLLANRKVLRKVGRKRIVEAKFKEQLPIRSDGLIKGKDADGNDMIGKVTGKSLVQQIKERKLKEKLELKEQQDKNKKRDKRQRRRNRQNTESR